MEKRFSLMTVYTSVKCLGIAGFAYLLNTHMSLFCRLAEQPRWPLSACAPPARGCFRIAIFPLSTHLHGRSCPSWRALQVCAGPCTRSPQSLTKVSLAQDICGTHNWSDSLYTFCMGSLFDFNSVLNILPFPKFSNIKICLIYSHLWKIIQISVFPTSKFPVSSCFSWKFYYTQT